ncbi:MAG: DNA recombination protein RmuC, partial [Desulfotomaculales bacterium]
LEEATQKLTDTFNSRAGEALKSNNQAFLALARQTLETFIAEAKGDLGQRQQAIEALVAPLKEALERYDREIREIEKARQEAYGGLTRYLQELSQTQQQLQSQTAKLVTALRAPRARGRWGEITLQRVVEMSGMSPYCDFITQPTTDTEDGRLRPDLIINLPNGRAIVVDAKTPLEAYLDAVETEDEDARRAALQRHAQAVRGHMQRRGSKDYQSQFRFSIDFVVLFLPGEPYFGAAVEYDPALIEDAVNRRVLLATPVTLVALLKAVAYGWQQRHATENAERVIDAGRQLFDRVCVFAEYLAGIRKGLFFERGRILQPGRGFLAEPPGARCTPPERAGRGSGAEGR